MLDPMPPAPPWFADLRADLDAAPGTRVAQLATVAPEGRPEVRSVVIRGLTESGVPWFATDARSRKLAGERATEACLWIPELRTQWRIGGVADVVGPEAEGAWAERRDRSWARSDPQVRLHLTGSPPGTRLAREPLPDAPVPMDLPEEPTAHFVLVRIAPERVERLVLGTPHRRSRWTRANGGWTYDPVMP